MAIDSLPAASQPIARYHVSQRAMHWVMALMIILAIAIGLYCSYLGRGSAERQFLMDIHKSLGMTVLALMVIRIPLRGAYGQPASSVEAPWSEKAASITVHTALYALMLVMPLSGYATSSLEGRTVPWFGLFNWPNLLHDDPSLGRAIGAIHEYSGYALIGLLAMHLAAVVWHRFVRRDEVLSRML